jgi:hypothetical protein
MVFQKNYGGNWFPSKEQVLKDMDEAGEIEYQVHVSDITEPLGAILRDRTRELKNETRILKALKKNFKSSVVGISHDSVHGDGQSVRFQRPEAMLDENKQRAQADGSKSLLRSISAAVDVSKPSDDESAYELIHHNASTGRVNKAACISCLQKCAGMKGKSLKQVSTPRQIGDQWDAADLGSHPVTPGVQHLLIHAKAGGIMDSTLDANGDLADTSTEDEHLEPITPEKTHPQTIDPRLYGGSSFEDEDEV